MYICLNCKEQFNSGMTRYGDCPHCGTTNMLAQDRKNLEANVLNNIDLRIKKIMRFIDRRKLGR